MTHDSVAAKEESALGQPSVRGDLSGTVITSGQASFRLMKFLGAGSTGVVYEALDEKLDRRVAVKILNPAGMAGALDSQRFQREAAFSGMLSHPGVVKTYLAGWMPDGTPFLVMEYLRGDTLSAILSAEGALSGERFFGLFNQLIDAIAYLHRNGVIHRDIKPSNVFIVNECSEERVVVLDFGLAKFMHDVKADQRLTRTGTVLGTSLYMSPEQCLGKGVDCRTDVYSLGCMMFEALTGRPPFDGGSSYEVMYKHINNTVSGWANYKSITPSLADLSFCQMLCSENFRRPPFPL